MKRNHILARGILPALTILFNASEAGASPAAEAVKPYVLPKIPTKRTKETVETKKLATTLGTQPRVAMDPTTVAHYKELIKEAKDNGKPYPLPPIQCVRTPEGKMIPWDGFHRIEANKGLHSEIELEWVEGDEQLAFLLSLSANAKHGLPRTNRDKVNAVKRAFQNPEVATLSDGAIAELCEVSASLVRTHRPALKAGAVRTDKRGRKIDTSGVGKKGGKKKKPAKSKGKQGAKKDGKSDEKKASASQARLSELVTKIEKLIGGAEGAKVRSAIVAGSLELTIKDLQDWASLKEPAAKGIVPLVTGNRMKPWKAFEFFTSEPKEAVIADLHNRALSHGGEYTFEKDGLKLVVTITKK